MKLVNDLVLFKFSRDYSCVIVENFRVIILELNYTGQIGQVIVLNYIAKVIVLDCIAKVIVIMITIIITNVLLHMPVSQVPLQCKQAFLFILYLMHAPRVYFNSV